MGAKQKQLQEEVAKHHQLKEELAQLTDDEDYKHKVELMEAVKVQKKVVKEIKKELRENYVVITSYSIHYTKLYD